jgi:hypothetical protein
VFLGFDVDVTIFSKFCVKMGVLDSNYCYLGRKKLLSRVTLHYVHHLKMHCVTALKMLCTFSAVFWNTSQDCFTGALKNIGILHWVQLLTIRFDDALRHSN